MLLQVYPRKHPENQWLEPFESWRWITGLKIFGIQKTTRWWFQISFIFSPTWGNDPNGWFNHQLDKNLLCAECPTTWLEALDETRLIQECWLRAAITDVHEVHRGCAHASGDTDQVPTGFYTEGLAVAQGILRPQEARLLREEPESPRLDLSKWSHSPFWHAFGSQVRLKRFESWRLMLQRFCPFQKGWFSGSKWWYL